MTDQPLTIGMDVRYLSHGLVGGVHTYVTNLTKALLTSESGYRFLLYADTKADFEMHQLPERAGLRLLPWRAAPSSFRNDFGIGGFMQRDGVQVAHFPANYGFAPAGMSTVITLHDAINLLPIRDILRDDSKRPRHALMMTYLHLMTSRAMRQNPLVVTVSEYSRREILRQTSLPDDHVRVVYSAPDRRFRPDDAGLQRDMRTRLRLRDRVLIADAIKNPECTLRAYRALPSSVRDETSLLFFSRRTPSASVLEAHERGEVVLVIQPSTEDLVTLYTLADLLVFPSWYEGFGLPVLEAMSCGTPAIVSSRGSLPEIAGPGGIVADAEDHQAISSEIQSLFDSGDRLATLSEQAVSWSRAFSWEASAQQMLEMYAEAAARNDFQREVEPRHRRVSRNGRKTPSNLAQ